MRRAPTHTIYFYVRPISKHTNWTPTTKQHDGNIMKNDDVDDVRDERFLVPLLRLAVLAAIFVINTVVSANQN
jgi:hypothetical protein